MNFKTFMSIWLIFVATISALIIVIPQTHRSAKNEIESPHFSVVWKGFAPSYSNQTPDYYICINNLQDSVLQMHIALQIQNCENSSYWFMIDQHTTPPTGWNVTPYYFGRIDVDETKTLTYSELARQKPTTIPEGRTTESVELAVRAYDDASYTSLYSQANFTIRFHFIDLNSPAWTILYNDNFDDGTTQGWAGYLYDLEWYNHYRSWPCSLFGYGYLYKSFDTSGPFNETYILLPLRVSDSGLTIRINLDDIQCFETDLTLEPNVWYQFIMPLPLSSFTELKIQGSSYSFMNIDDIYVVAK